MGLALAEVEQRSWRSACNVCRWSRGWVSGLVRSALDVGEIVHSWYIASSTMKVVVVIRYVDCELRWVARNPQPID